MASKEEGETSQQGGGETSNDLYLEAYNMVQKATVFEGIGNREGAIRTFERALQLMERAEQMPDYKRSGLNLKMSTTKAHVTYR